MVEICLYISTLCVSCQLCNIFTLWRKHHKRNTKYSISTSSKYFKFDIRISHFKSHFSTFRTANPVLLCLFQRICPIYLVQSIQQTLSVCTHAQTPLTHNTLFHRVTTTHRQTFTHLIISQNSTQRRTPIHLQISQISNTIIHQHLLLASFVPRIPLFCCKNRSLATCCFYLSITLLFEYINKHRNRFCSIRTITIPMVKHLNKSPLSPFVVTRFTSAHLTTPVVAETYFVQLLTITSDIFFCSNSRVLTCLNSILLCRQSVCVITHRVQHIETLQSFVAAINVRSNITKRVSHVQSRSRWVRKHIKHIEFRTRFVYFYLISSMFIPILLPLFLNLLKFIFHIYNLKLFISVCYAVSAIRRYSIYKDNKKSTKNKIQITKK